MGYKKAGNVLPRELLEKVQEYVDGECIYIPRLSEKKQEWGAKTSTREELRERNHRIFEEYLAGACTEALAGKYFLSVKSIQRIVGQLKKKNIESEEVFPDRSEQK